MTAPFGQSRDGLAGTNSIVHLSIRLEGVVQGVGFRPFVACLARKHELSGSVRNADGAVIIDIEGRYGAASTFLIALHASPPAGAELRSIDIKEGPPRAAHSAEANVAHGARTFVIEESVAENYFALSAIVPDRGPCAECIAEISLKNGRRSAYPFTSCTACGPRYTIAHKVPFDRKNTSMDSFSLCAHCEEEALDPNDHRYHAQTLACPKCGPTLTFEPALQPHPYALNDSNTPEQRNNLAIDQAVLALKQGSIVAIKGVGGYQLLVDACNEANVAELRRRKRRDDKPFAVLFGCIEAALEYAVITPDETNVLMSSARPIVLCESRQRPQAARPLAFAISKGLPWVGVHLPASPLHYLLAKLFFGPLVCTSGNLNKEPILTDDEEAKKRLHTICDYFLWHNRLIVRPCDDSVVRVVPRPSADVFSPPKAHPKGATKMKENRAEPSIATIRRARGFAPVSMKRISSVSFEQTPAPNSFALPKKVNNEVVLALGGHLKSTIAIGTSNDIWVSQHLGDLGDVRSLTLFQRTISEVLKLRKGPPSAIVCDLHPAYASSQVAEKLAIELGVPLVRVLHHHAHIASVAAEHKLRGPVIGFAWDGAGDGGDGTLWGGETLLCDGVYCERLATMRPFPLPGGERAMSEPRRSLFGMFSELGLAHKAPGFTKAETENLMTMVKRGFQSPKTTSVGRLFDAVSALIGNRNIASFEGQAAMELEGMAGPANDSFFPHESYPFLLFGPMVGATPNTSFFQCEAGAMPTGAPFQCEATSGASPQTYKLSGAELLRMDWGPLLLHIQEDVERGVSKSLISQKFHATLARFALCAVYHSIELAKRLGKPTRDVVLGGGCFQNMRLRIAVTSLLKAASFNVFCAEKFPSNDGGLSLGQAHIALGE